MTDADPALRISDADREEVVARLRTASEEGRLDLGELEERVTAAYAAKTAADLTPLTADLPTRPAASSPAVDVARRQAFLRRSLPLLIPNVACIGVWLASGADGGFWPVWVLLGTGIAWVSMLVKYVSGDDDLDGGPQLPPPPPPPPPVR